MQNNLYHQFDISIQDLQVFLALADSLSFGDAAKALGRSQPTISNRLKLLEDKLQTQLILRTSKFVSLSDDGKQFRDYALRVVEEMSILHNRFHEKGQKRPSVIKVCSTTMIGFAGVRAGVKKLGELNPQLKIEYRVDTAKNCIQLVLDGHADLAVVPDDSLPPDVQFTPLLVDTCQAIAAAGHKLAHRKSASLSEILEYPILSPDMHMEMRQQLIDEAEKRGIKVNLVPEAFGVTSFMSLLALASSDTGIAINSAAFIPGTFKSMFGVIEIEDCRIERIFGMVTAKGQTPSPAVKLFSKYMEKIAAELESKRGAA